MKENKDNKKGFLIGISDTKVIRSHTTQDITVKPNDRIISEGSIKITCGNTSPSTTNTCGGFITTMPSSYGDHLTKQKEKKP
jgi:hypothetical protein